MILFLSKSWQSETGVREDLKCFIFMSEQKVHVKVAES